MPAIAAHVELLAGQPDAAGLRALFTTWITLPQRGSTCWCPRSPTARVRLAGDGRWQEAARSVLELGERYPGDAGVLAALLLNRVTLAPGEALYLPAGNLHTYLYGVGVEVMANSDNVLRGGLTPKHVDVPELLRVLDFTPSRRPSSPGWPRAAWVRYDTPAEEFLLRRFAPVTARPRCPTAARGSCCAPRVRPSCAAHGTELDAGQGGRGVARGLRRRRHGRAAQRRHAAVPRG